MPIDPTTLEKIAQLYNIPVSQLKPVSGGHSSLVYEYRVGQRSCILKITPPNTDIDLHSMRSMLEWMAFLAEHDGPVVRPLRSRHGNLIEQAGRDDQLYSSVSFEKSPGFLAERLPLADWNDKLFQALGNTLGLCHRLSQVYIPGEEFKRPEWNLSVNCFNNPVDELERAGPVVLEKRARMLAALQALPKDKDSYGLVHLDLHFGNFLVDVKNQKIILIDFDDCAHGWYVMDIAMLLFDILVVYAGPDRERFGERFLDNLLKGYRLQKPISAFWIRQLPIFLKLLEIGVYLQVERDYDPATADGWVGKFMPDRRERIEQETAYVELDFVALSRKAGE
jgi:Ser/Thr protein kinase RdoA (MazF antagonist)